MQDTDTPDTKPRKKLSQQEYREGYLQSAHWAAMRLGALAAADHRCQVCNADRNLDVHHRTYERLHAERPADLTVLCRRCHSLFHGVLPKPGGQSTGKGSKTSKAAVASRAASKAAKKRRRKQNQKRSKQQQETLAQSLAAMKERNGPLPLRMSDYGAAVDALDTPTEEAAA